MADHKNLVFQLTCVSAIQEGANKGLKASIELLEKYKNDSHPAISAAADTDFYSFNLATAACKQELSEQTISLQQFSDWIMRTYR